MMRRRRRRRRITMSMTTMRTDGVEEENALE